MSLEASTQAPWLLPTVATLGALVTGALVVRRLRAGSTFGFVDFWGVAFAVTTLLDAVLTSKLSPLAASTGLAVFFVILGDFRLFWLSERAARPKGPILTAARRAVGFAFVTPVLQHGSKHFFPELYAGKDLRYTFLAYEIVCLVVLGLYVKLGAREGDDADVALGNRLVAFFAAQYALWIAADVLILFVPAARDLGFGLRLVPNVLYYGVFVPVGYALALPRLGK